MNLIRTNRNTLLDLASKNCEVRSLKHKKTFKDGVNQRASIKQRQLVDAIAKVAKCNTQIIEPDLCKKELYFDDFPYINSIRVSYFTKNNLFSRIFELIMESSFKAVIENRFETDIELGISYKGRLKVSDVSFTALSQNDSALCFAERLNQIDLIAKRVLHLEALDLKIRYSASSSTWTVGLATGKGSTVWTLFPPLLMLVPFTEADAMRLLELYQLIIYEIKQFESIDTI